MANPLRPHVVPARYRAAIAGVLAESVCPLCGDVGTIALEDRTVPVRGALMRTTRETWAVCQTPGCEMVARTTRMWGDDE